MHTPNHFKVKNFDILFRFIQENSFATLVSVAEGKPVLSHMPSMIERRGGEFWVLSHLAKANPQAAVLEQAPMTAIFQGPSAYVSPNLYDKQQNVPTWNYIAVHATGQAKIIAAEREVEGFFYKMFEKYDPDYMKQWDELSPKYIKALYQALVAFEMKVDTFEGQFKLSQNKSAKERSTIIDSLAQSDKSPIVAVSKWMREF